jgi:protein tyrosine phosphatase (PTP) superfamily phosphohydrolase (DUF442 family)
MVNMLQVAPGLWTGSRPRGAADFQALSDLGIRMAISVDSGRPDLDNARAFGIQYVHIPLGYGGVSRDQQIQLALALSKGDGAIYLHCHHGRHRAPTAAALALYSLGRTSRQSALAILDRAGTSDGYSGLRACVREARPVSSSDLDSCAMALPESVAVADFVASMVKLDDLIDQLAVIHDLGKPAEASRPPATALVDASSLADLFRVLQEEASSRPNGNAMVPVLREIGSDADLLDQQVERKDWAAASISLKRIAHGCMTCHRRFRD